MFMSNSREKHNIQKYILYEYFITQNTASMKDKLKHQSKSVYEPILQHTSLQKASIQV